MTTLNTLISAPATHQLPWRVFDGTADLLLLDTRRGVFFSPTNELCIPSTAPAELDAWNYRPQEWEELLPRSTKYWANLRFLLDRSSQLPAVLGYMYRFRPYFTRRISPTPQPSLRAHYRGVPLDEGKYTRLRAWCKDPMYQAAVKAALRDGEYEPLCDYYNNCVAAIPRRWLAGHSNDNVVHTDCGHFAYRDDTSTTADDAHTYCSFCSTLYFVEVTDAPRYRRGLYHRDDVYLWSDGEFRLEEEEEEEEDTRDDDDDNANGLLYSWETSTSHLAYEKFVTRPYGDFLMGIELEVDAEDDRSDAIYRCDAHFNRDMRYVMFKRDGSLDDRSGFEIVTAARRLSDHLELFGTWQPPSDLRAWGVSACGMHIHIDSRAFSPLHLGKFLQFYNDPKNAPLIKAIAGRHAVDGGSAASYAALIPQPDGGLSPTTSKKAAGSHRYYIVNLTNLSSSERDRLKQDAVRDCKGDYSTVEIRVFKATLKKTRLLAQFEFAHASVCFTREAAIHELNGRGFIAFLTKNAGRYKHLARWFGVFIPKATKQRPTPTRPTYTPAQFCA